VSRRNGDQPDLLDNPAFLQLVQSQHMIAAGQEEIADAIRVGPVDVAVADLRRRYTRVPNFVLEGSERAVLGTPGFGGSYQLAANTPQQLLPRNTHRLGGTIVNSGSGAVTLYLCELGDQAAANEPLPQIWLGAGGGAWDLRLGNALWCGTVVAVSVTGSSVSVAEV